MERIRRIWGRIARRKWLGTGLVALLLFLVLIPLYRQAIMCNDELLSRYWSMKGFTQFYRYFWDDLVGRGRALSAGVIPVTMYLGFLGSGNGTFKIVQILSILLDVSLFMLLLERLFHDRKFAVVCGLSVVAFLPVTFEHTVPNAFNTLYNIPFSLLLLSLVLFSEYLEKGGKKKMAFSMLLLFINLTCYESFVMFLPLYWGIAVGKVGLDKRKRLLKVCACPATVGALFLLLYVMSSVLFPSHYPGNQISEISFGKMIAIISQLSGASFPGYYCFVPKYHYLADYYNHLGAAEYARILAVCLIFFAIVHMLLGRGTGKPVGLKSLFACLGMGGLCVILPTLPLSVASMYQQTVGTDSWIAVPTNWFCYFGATFLCWFLVWQLVGRYRRKAAVFLAAAAAAIYLFPVQAMNDIFSQQQNRAFQRLTRIESLFSTELFRALDGNMFYSTDCFETVNALVIHDSYWNDYAASQGLGIRIANYEGSAADNRIYYDGEQFTVWYGNAACVITSRPEEGVGTCQDGGETGKEIQFTETTEDSEFYEYYYRLAETGELEACCREDFLKGRQQ